MAKIIFGSELNKPRLWYIFNLNLFVYIFIRLLICDEGENLNAGTM